MCFFYVYYKFWLNNYNFTFTLYNTPLTSLKQNIPHFSCLCCPTTWIMVTNNYHINTTISCRIGLSKIIGLCHLQIQTNLFGRIVCSGSPNQTRESHILFWLVDLWLFILFFIDRRNAKVIINSHTQVKVPGFESRSWRSTL